MWKIYKCNEISPTSTISPLRGGAGFSEGNLAWLNVVNGFIGHHHVQDLGGWATLPADWMSIMYTVWVAVGVAVGAAVGVVGVVGVMGVMAIVTVGSSSSSSNNGMWAWSRQVQKDCNIGYRLVSIGVSVTMVYELPQTKCLVLSKRKTSWGRAVQSLCL